MSHADPTAAHLEAIAPGGDTIARLDPRTRLLAAVAFAVVTVSLSQPAPLAAAAVVALALAVAARLPLRATARRLLAVDGFILAMLVSLPFTTPGTPLASLGPLTASREGAALAAAIAVKANAVLVALMALVGTLEPARLAHALERLRVPPVLVQLLVFTVRYIDVLRDEYGRLRRAMRARAFTPRTDRHTLRALGHLIGMLVVRAAERAERVLEAMKCRGFRGRFALLAELRFSRADGRAAALATLVLVLLLAAEIALVPAARP
jgi:cobalt/nickel transport system permease protein